MTVHIKEFAEKLSELYKKAKTREEYEEVIGRGTEIETALVGEFPDITAPIISPFYWARYYLLLKFPSSKRERVDFFLEVDQMFSQVKDPDNRVALLYLKSVILSNLLNDQRGARWCIIAISKIISEGKISIASILRHINARVIKEMVDKNWSEAAKISEEIGIFPEDILRQPENLGHAANVLNNWGASLVRGDIDIVLGREKLLIAKDYYLREEVPSEKHLDGIKNRLREADEKS
ncbi:MAG: hypothetical protein U9N04_01135 [Patescibacteria group bacterium]|nr:hypothetical protein [Patescibacteria group bacterium]